MGERGAGVGVAVSGDLCGGRGEEECLLGDA